MKIILTFFWIAIGAVLLWFFAENLDQHVNIYLFTRTYQNVNLVTVIFFSTLLGVLLGAFIMALRIIKEKARAGLVKKENKHLNKDIENLRSKNEKLMLQLKTLQDTKSQQDAKSQNNDTAKLAPGENGA